MCCSRRQKPNPLLRAAGVKAEAQNGPSKARRRDAGEHRSKMFAAGYDVDPLVSAPLGRKVTTRSSERRPRACPGAILPTADSLQRDPDVRVAKENRDALDRNALLEQPDRERIAQAVKVCTLHMGKIGQ
jgi:hypothetical protein